MRVVHVRVSLADFGGVFEAMREWLDRKNCVLEHFGTEAGDLRQMHLPRGAWWRLLAQTRNDPVRPRIAERLETMGDACGERREWFTAAELKKLLMIWIRFG